MNLSSRETLKSQVKSLNHIDNNSKYSIEQKIDSKKIKTPNTQVQYNSIEGGADIIKNRCVDTDIKINELSRLIATQSVLALTDNKIYPLIEGWKKQLSQLKADYELNGCIAKVEEVKQASVKEVIDTYQAVDKARIETVTNYERNKRVFFGAIILMLALVMISTNKKQ